MNRKRAVRLLKPLLTVIAVIVLSGMLVLAIHFGALDLQWITFLSGVLAASLLAMVVRAARAEFFAARRLARLTILQQRIGSDKKRADELEKALAACKARLHFADEALPVMVAFVDSQMRYQYHNHACREWLGLRKEKIDGKHMRDVHGRKAFRELEPAVAKAMEGRPVQFELHQRTPGAAVYRLSIQCLPQFDARRNPAGFCMVIADVTEATDVRLAAPEPQVPARAPGDPASGITEEVAGGNPDAAPIAQDAADSSSALDRIVNAIKRGEFSLLYQPIRALQAAPDSPQHYEMFLRQVEEENNLLPPGAFFPLAAEHGLLPQLDRWVVEHLLSWLASRKSILKDRTSAFFLNTATETLCEADFPDFIEYQLRKTGIPAPTLCFEITEVALTSRPSEVRRFVSLVREQGCRVALSGFGRGGMSVEFLKTCPLDFLKIHGSLILALERDSAELGKLLALSRISKVIGIKTIAEMVETNQTIAKLREAGVDFAQGFGIAKPKPLATFAADG